MPGKAQTTGASVSRPLYSRDRIQHAAGRAGAATASPRSAQAACVPAPLGRVQGAPAILSVKAPFAGRRGLFGAAAPGRGVGGRARRRRGPSCRAVRFLREEPGVQTVGTSGVCAAGTWVCDLQDVFLTCLKQTTQF